MILYRKNWNSIDYKHFLQFLYSLEDKKYKEFHSKLILNNKNIIGIRTPKLKEIAKDISKGNYLEFIKLCQNNLYEEKIIYGLVLGYIKSDFKTITSLLDTYIYNIDNWAINDIVCANLKIFKTNQTEGFKYINKLLKNKNPFIIRFALVLLLDFYINDKYINEVLMIADKVKNNNYYVQMANAWLISICYIKYPNKTKTFLSNNNLNPWTQNKAISKIKDSKRVIDKDKKEISKLKKQS